MRIVDLEYSSCAFEGVTGMQDAKSNRLRRSLFWGLDPIFCEIPLSPVTHCTSSCFTPKSLPSLKDRTLSFVLMGVARADNVTSSYLAKMSWKCILMRQNHFALCFAWRLLYFFGGDDHCQVRIHSERTGDDKREESWEKAERMSQILHEIKRRMHCDDVTVTRWRI